MDVIQLPVLGQSVEEASIVEWFKKEGDTVAKGDPIFSIQTDKAEIECESTASGVLRKIIVGPDIEVPVLTVVGLVGDADEELPDLAQYAVEAAEAAPEEEAPAKAEAPPATPAPEAPAPSAAPIPSPAPASGEIIASPRARAFAKSANVDIRFVRGTGAGGRIMETDVAAYGAIKITPVARRLARDAELDISLIEGTGPGGRITKDDVTRAAAAPKAAVRTGPASGEVTRVALTPMRRIIAERMCASAYSAPHYYVTVEVDMAEAMAFRKGLDFKASFNDLLMRAVALSTGEFPDVNARWADDAVELLGDVNIGVAVALPTGLIVPVVRQVQDKTLQGVAQDSTALIEKARTGKLTPDDYSGNTFTISNLGAFGVDHFTAIINQPDAAILAVGQIKERPVVIDGGIHVRPIMKMTLSSDHRVIDGAIAAQFMGTLKGRLESADF